MRINPFKLFIGAFIPNWLCSRKEISQGAKLTYAQLCRHAGQGGVAWPALETLGEEIGTTERQIRRYVDELVEQKLIETEQRGLRQCNRYFFLEHEWMSTPDRTQTSDQERTNTPTQERTQMSGPSVRESLEVESKKENYSSFDDFWNVYPRREGKVDALKAWKALKPDAELLLRIIHNLSRYADTEKRFIPLPATYLRGRRWEDGPTVAEVAAPKPLPQAVTRARSENDEAMAEKITPEQAAANKEFLASLRRSISLR